MEKVLKHGLMVLSMKAVTLKEKSMEKVLLLLLMDLSTMETSSTMKFLEKESMYGLMERHMMVNGRRIRCMDMVF